eukprot:1131515-Amphidinium_carterae.1
MITSRLTSLQILRLSLASDVNVSCLALTACRRCHRATHLRIIFQAHGPRMVDPVPGMFTDLSRGSKDVASCASHRPHDQREVSLKEFALRGPSPCSTIATKHHRNTHKILTILQSIVNITVACVLVREGSDVPPCSSDPDESILNGLMRRAVPAVAFEVSGSLGQGMANSRPAPKDHCAFP